MPENKGELEDLEINLILEAIFQYYGWDFRDYAAASVKRRILKSLQEEKINTISGYQEKILHDSTYMQRFLGALSINVTAMFRDPDFYLAFRNKVVPLLRDLPLIRIWHVGCSTGEEVFSMAILLKEEGLYEKTKLYATDMNEIVIKKAKNGIFPLKVMRDYTKNYLDAGGKGSFSKYYTAKYNNIIFKPALQKNIVWAQHNLVSDGSFNEFNVIICRNVMIYFNHKLQSRVHDLIYESLAISGILGLGSKESIQFTPHISDYQTLDIKEKIYQKKR